MSDDNVIAALARVSREVGAIEKARSPQSGPKYDYRGIEDVLNAMHGPLHRNGVVIVPRVTRAEMVERKNGQEAQMLVEYRIYGPGGTNDFIDTSVFATGMDQGDKATGKALSYAYKSMAFQLLCIPTDAIEDNEATNQVVQALPPEPAWDEARWLDLADRLRALPDERRDKVVRLLESRGLFKNRLPVGAFTDADLDYIHKFVMGEERDEQASGAMPDPSDNGLLEDWQRELADLEDVAAFDWKKAAGKLIPLRPVPLFKMAKEAAARIGADEPHDLGSIDGAVGQELVLALIDLQPPF